jgi:hypothetical protein
MLLIVGGNAAFDVFDGAHRRNKSGSYPSNCGCSCLMRLMVMAAAAVRVSTPSLAKDVF